MNKKIVIAATGGFAKEVLTILNDLGIIDQFAGFIEPDVFIEKGNIPTELLGYPVMKYSKISSEKTP
jgi:hypothetical protein